MPYTHTERRAMQRDAHTELAVLSAAHRDDLLKNKDVSQYAAPIKQARLALLTGIKPALEREGLKEERWEE